jgi:hypothetical protein
MIQIRDVKRSVAAGAFLGRIFTDDPVWHMFGPRWRPYRRLISILFHIGEVSVGKHRHGAWVIGAYQDEKLVGVMLANPAGEAKPSLWYWVSRPLAFALAGPMPTIRAVQFGDALEKLEPSEPHVHCWFVAASRDTRGVGTMLMREVIRRANELGKPCYLEATNDEVARLYALLGYERTGTYTMRDGEPIELMWREMGERSRTRRSGTKAVEV